MATSPGPAPEAADGDLLTQVARGSADAFAGLYDRFAPIVHGIARAQYADPESATAATGAAFLTIWRLAPRYRPATQDATAWLLAVAHQAMTRPARVPERTSSDATETEAASAEGAPRPSSGQSC